MKCLIIGPQWVGDMVMAQTLFKAIKKTNAVTSNHDTINDTKNVPHVTIDVLAPLALCPLLERMPEVHQAIPVSLPHNELHLKYRLEIAASLKNKYDHCIVLTNSWKSALIPWFARIPKRTGWLGEMRFGLLNDIRMYKASEFPRMVDRFVMLAYPKKTALSEFRTAIEAPKLANNPLSVQRTLKKFSAKFKTPILALCPGAEFGASKRWPEEYYAELARLKMEEGWSVWIFGSKKDRVVSEKITTQLKTLTTDNTMTATIPAVNTTIPANTMTTSTLPTLDYKSHCIDFTGETSLDEAIDLLSLTTAVVSNDSGLMHIAAALDKPLVAIYGSTDPNFTPPLHSKAQIVRIEDLACSPCFKRACPLKENQYHRCMRDLKPRLVFEGLKKLETRNHQEASRVTT